MSITEEVVDAPRLAPGTSRVLLVWDAPNLDMGLGSILGGRPTAAHRPRFDALGRWLLARTAELSAGQDDMSLEPEAKTVTSTPTCWTTSPCAAPTGWPGCWWPRPTDRHSVSRWRTSPVQVPLFNCSDFAKMRAGRYPLIIWSSST